MYSPLQNYLVADLDIQFECLCLPHLLCLPNFSPCDYHIFGPLKADLGGKRPSDLMKKCRRQCTSSYTHSQRILFASHQRNTPGHALWATRAMLQNDNAVSNLFAPNQLVKKLQH
jgi:hypothetical protein